MQFEFFSKNTEILPIQDANISISNIEYAYGFGVYELIKIRNQIVYFEKQHIERLLSSAKIIDLEHNFTEKIISEQIRKVFNGNTIDSANLKILLIGGKTAADANLFIIPFAPLFPKNEFYAKGVDTLTFKFQRLFPNAKTLNMLGSYLAYKTAKKQNCYDALLLDEDANITEGTRTNFFAIKNKTIFTQMDIIILQGVTRETVLYVAKKLGFEIKITDIKINTLKNFDGAFLTSTSSKIVPVRKIDKFEFSEITENIKLLMKEYDNFLEESKGRFNP